MNCDKQIGYSHLKGTAQHGKAQLNDGVALTGQRERRKRG
jgi:hypothetical protein